MKRPMDIVWVRVTVWTVCLLVHNIGQVTVDAMSTEAAQTWMSTYIDDSLENKDSRLESNGTQPLAMSTEAHTSIDGSLVNHYSRLESNGTQPVAMSTEALTSMDGSLVNHYSRLESNGTQPVAISTEANTVTAPTLMSTNKGGSLQQESNKPWLGSDGESGRHTVTMSTEEAHRVGGALSTTEKEDNKSSPPPPPRKSFSLTTEDIFSCILANSSITLDNQAEMEIDFTQEKKTTFTTTRAATHSAGSCAVFLQAPQGKVLSVLFLNQTCSHDNRVHVHDPGDGRRTPWTGCEGLRRTPGYDLTSTNRSVTLDVLLDDPGAFYRLHVHVLALEPSSRQGLFVRPVSSHFGYIQTPGWHPYDKFTLAGGFINNAVTLPVPPGHVIMVSVAYLYTKTNGNRNFVASAVILTKTGKTTGLTSVVWRICCVDVPDVTVLDDVTVVTVTYRGEAGVFFTGVRLLYSFHQSSRTPDREEPGGLWNCSVPEWTEWRQHLLCNRKTECQGGEDELYCPDTSCQQGGILLDDSCYLFDPLPEWCTWTTARTACRQRGGALASLTTLVQYHHLPLLMLIPSLWSGIYIFIGLQSAEENFPHMYRFVLQWEDGPIAHYSRYDPMSYPPSCGHVATDYPDNIDVVYCNQPWGEATDALCLLPHVHHDEKREDTHNQKEPSSSAREGEELDKETTGEGEVPFDPDRGMTTSTRPSLTLNSPSQSPRQAFPSVSCPDRHLTHHFLACDAQSACWLDYGVSFDSSDDVGISTGDDVSLNNFSTNTVDDDAGSDKSDVRSINKDDASSDDNNGMPSSERTVVCATPATSQNADDTNVQAMFTCQSGGRLVPYSLVCDHLQDCPDQSDEKFCVFPPCSAASLFQCANKQCLPLEQRCDDIAQCLDESEEADCDSQVFVTSGEKTSPRPPLLANFNGKGTIVYTPLPMVPTPPGGEFLLYRCPDTHFFCPGDGYCLPVYVMCNGVLDCPGGEDEVDCDSFTCPGFYRCRGLQPVCLHPSHLCDGWPQCPQHDDERFCRLTCPADNCTCLGHAFTCHNDFQVEEFLELRYLDAAASGLTPDRARSNRMLIYLSLARCKLTHLAVITASSSSNGSRTYLALPNLRSLDLSDNLITTVLAEDLIGLNNLQNLSLARNPISTLFSGLSKLSELLPTDPISQLNNNSSAVFFSNILHVDLSGGVLETLDVNLSLPFPRLLSLNLTHSDVTRVTGDGFRSLTSLATLDLRGCPMTSFPRDVFEGLRQLRRVYADNYKLCCASTLPEGFPEGSCQAPTDEVSSCDSLLRSDVYRVCLAVLAALAVSGNLGCFCLRALTLIRRNSSKSGFNVFVAHLCVSDFLMGVYLVVIGWADRLYTGIYLWEDLTWRLSASCTAAGVLALLSSEVSALIICLITLDRFLAIRFPFSALRFSPCSAHLVCMLAWLAGAGIVTVPLLPATSHWQFYGQTGICVPLPITRQSSDFADAGGGSQYAYGVMILLNLVLFLLIAAGQISVYLAMRAQSSAATTLATNSRSRDLLVARRLLTVVVTDFLCWFPIALLGLLAARGSPVPGGVNVATAILVLPLNAGLNPFLYTINTVQEKRRKLREERLLRVVMEKGTST